MPYPHFDAMNLSIRQKLFLSHFLAIMLILGSIGAYFYHSALSNLLSSLQSRLQYSAALLSHNFEGALLDTIQKPEDQDGEAYQKVVHHLRELAASNPDIAFIYIMRLQDGKPVFVVDSDIENPAEPGEVYQHSIPELMKGFQRSSVDTGITSDRWGSFMSGYAPIKGGKSSYMVGLDMRADDVNAILTGLRGKALVSLLFGVLLAYLSSHVLARSMLRRISLLHGRCLETSALPEGAVPRRGDELDELNQSFDFMLNSMQETHLELEAKVEQRTQELAAANTLLQQEIDERKNAEEALKETARTDYLTGLINRREMTNMLLHSATQNTRFHLSFSVVLLDIDNFKKINDDYGHDIGDEVLRAVSQTLRRLLRSSDTLARWGGEELIILLPDTEQTDAVLQAEKLRAALEKTSFKAGKQILSVTASFGVAEYSPVEGLAFTLKQADLALYRAKQLGRNRVLIAEEYFAADR